MQKGFYESEVIAITKAGHLQNKEFTKQEDQQITKPESIKFKIH